MNDELILQGIRAKPGPYLYDHARVDGASIYGNFLLGVYDQAGCLTTPSVVELSAHYEYQRACASDCQLRWAVDGGPKIPLDYGNTPGVVNYLWQQCLMEPDNRPSQPKPLEAFSYIALMAFAAEYCIVDISAADEHFRQAFYQGRAVTPCERRPLQQMGSGTPYLQVCFTIAPPVFRSRVITSGQVKEAVQELRKRAWIPRALHLMHLRQKMDGFVMRLALE